jgi:hypothetical protein
MSILSINKPKLSTNETVRYSGPAVPGNTHGIYTVTILSDVTENKIEIHMSLEATIQLKQRLDAALAHMITH